MSREAQFTINDYPKTLLIGIHAPYNQTKNIESYFEEFLNLAKTNGVRNYETLYIKLREIDPTYFLTKGKLEEVKEFCQKHDIKEVIFSEQLTAQQERNLHDFIDCNVFDRTQLILEIFEKAAHSAEGKIQVSIAMLQFKKSRLVGKGIHLSQQSGVRGFRAGFGETQKEKDRRVIDGLVTKFKRQLEQIHRTRETQRKRRLESKVPHICIIGYTNAGKSTILNALTKSDVLAEDKLFATLDTTTRELYLNSKKIGIITDTVGFIQQLPPQLIEAFKSTLSELQYADLLLHVVDISDPNWESQIEVVHDILASLNVEKEMIYVFNKVDKIENVDGLEHALHRYQPHVLASAINKDGLDAVVESVTEWHKRIKPDAYEKSPEYSLEEEELID